MMFQLLAEDMRNAEYESSDCRGIYNNVIFRQLNGLFKYFHLCLPGIQDCSNFLRILSIDMLRCLQYAPFFLSFLNLHLCLFLGRLYHHHDLDHV